jgi:hypothetical protein
MDPTTAARATSAGPPIPGFRGDVFWPGTPGYDEKREQYAASSYPERMRPYLIAVPQKDSDDVPAAIRFAKATRSTSWLAAAVISTAGSPRVAKIRFC